MTILNNSSEQNIPRLNNVPLGILTNDQDERQVVKWEINETVTLVSYKKGRGKEPVQHVTTVDDRLLQSRLQASEKARKQGEKILSLQCDEGFVIKTQFTMHLCIDNDTSQIVHKFPRHPQSAEDISTPYDTVKMKKMAAMLGQKLSVLCLSAPASAIVDQHIEKFCNGFRDSLDGWVCYVDEKILQPWAVEGSFYTGNTRYSELAWACMTKFMLGIDSKDYIDYSHIWNTLFSPTHNILVKGVAKVVYYDKLTNYLLQQIRTNRSDRTLQKMLWDLWEPVKSKMKNEQLIDVNNALDGKKITIQEKFVLDNIITIMMGIQENPGFILTECSRIIALNPKLILWLQNDSKNIQKFIDEVLRLTPPAGSLRQLRWDTDILITDGKSSDKTYELNKGEMIGYHPLSIGRSIYSFDSPNEIHFDRRRKQQHCPFGKGIHRCPGELLARDMIKVVLQHIITTYKLGIKDKSLPDYYVSASLRPIPSVKIRLIERSKKKFVNS